MGSVKLRTEVPGPRSRELLRLVEEHTPRAVFHLTPIAVARALELAMPQNPQIQSSEIRRLLELGTRWDGRRETAAVPSGPAPPDAIEEGEGELWDMSGKETPF